MKSKAIILKRLEIQAQYWETLKAAQDTGSPLMLDVQFEKLADLFEDLQQLYDLLEEYQYAIEHFEDCTCPPDGSRTCQLCKDHHTLDIQPDDVTITPDNELPV